MRRVATWSALLLVAAVALAAIVAALVNGGSPPQANAVATASTIEASPAATDSTIAPDFNHISGADDQHFTAASVRLQTELEAIIACFHVGGHPTACVNYHRPGFVQAFQAARRVWNSTGPESRSNRCYRLLVSDGRALAKLHKASEPLFAVSESGGGFGAT